MSRPLLWLLGASIAFFAPATASAQSFGGAVAQAGGDVFAGYVGTTGKSGVIKVYRKSGGQWAEVAQLSASDATGDDDRFGRVLFASGNMLVAGATTRDENRGGAYVFERRGNMWSQTGMLVPDEVVAGDNLGRSVASNGSIVLVGGAGVDSSRGAVYAFSRNASGSWVQQAKLQPADLATNDLFGLTLAFDGELALVGALKQTNPPGDVYAYHFDAASNEWHDLGAIPVPEEPEPGFSFTIAIEGNRALVGAPFGNGAVYTYSFAEGQGWSLTGTLKPPSGVENSGFGGAIYVSGNDAYIGAPNHNSGGGAVYPYRYDESAMAWVAGERVEAVGETRGLGGAISVEGNVAAFGLPGADFGLGRLAIAEYDPSGLGWVVQGEFYDEVERMASVVGEEVSCESNAAAGFGCENVDLLSFLSVPDLGGGRGIQLNDIWGWTDPEDGTEYAIVGRMDGTSFVDISDPYNPVYVGNLPKTAGSQTNSWRDMKVYRDHVFIVADGAGEHGMQIFDLRQLRDVQSPPVAFEETAHYDGIHSAHNIVINEDTGFAYTVGNSSGGETCGGGSHMIDIRDPANPTFAGCFAHEETGRAGTGYTHDAQCVVYNGPDEQYAGREICFGSNETALSIADVTDKQNPVKISATSYPNVGYAHQGWVTEDHRYFLLDDELDELQGLVENTRTLIWDVSDLEDPQLIKEYMSESKSSDHNLYIKGNLVYQSNYVSGLRVLDITDINNPVEVGYFDTVPGDENNPGFDGSWSNYPFFESGVIVVTSGSEGLFLVRRNEIGL